MIKRFMTILTFLILLCFSSSAVMASAPTTKQEAVRIANDEIRPALGYDFFEDKNVDDKPIDWVKTERLSNVATGGLTGMGALVYGGPHGDIKNGTSRYLGYTYLGEDYTNPDFPHDAWGGGYLEDRNWTENPWNGKISGQKKNKFDGNIRYLPNIQMGIAFYYGESSKGGNSSYWDKWHNYMHVLVPPTEFTWGMGRMWHNLNGSLWYISVPLAPGILCELPDLSTSLETNKFTGVEPGQKITSTVAYRLNTDHNRAGEAKLRLYHKVGNTEYPVTLKPINNSPDPSNTVVMQPGQEFIYEYTVTVQSTSSVISSRINAAIANFPDKNWENNRAEATVTPQAIDISVGIVADNEYWSDGSNALSYEVIVNRKNSAPGPLPIKLTIFDKNGKTVKDFTMQAGKNRWNTHIMWERVQPGTYTIEAQAWPVEGQDINPADNVATKTIEAQNSSFNIDSQIKGGTGDISW